MKYVGSKNRIAKDIIPFIMDNKKEFYIEPFAGGMNLIDKVRLKNKIANDINEYSISMFDAVVNKGWIPPSIISNHEYVHIRDNKEQYPKEMVGFVGIACSFSGKWFGGYARGGDRNYCLESKKNLLKQAPKLKGTIFKQGSFLNLEVPQNSLIYCDPPYKGTTDSYIAKFDHTSFFEWCYEQKEKGNTVLLSEYSAPERFVCVWEKEIVSSLDKDTGSKRAVEKLYILK